MSREKLSKEKTGWDAAIANAKEHIGRLQSAISVFEENKKKDEPWPGTQSDIQLSGQQHSV